MKPEPASHPVWKKRQQALLDFLRKPRTWKEMVGFSRQRRWDEARLRNVLAYACPSIGYGPRGDDEGLRWWARSTAVGVEEE